MVEAREITDYDCENFRKKTEKDARTETTQKTFFYHELRTIMPLSGCMKNQKIVAHHFAPRFRLLVYRIFSMYF